MATVSVNEHELWLDGKFLTVTFEAREGGDSTPERIKVRKVPFCDLDVLSSVWGNFAGEVSCYADRPKEWVLRLTDASFQAVFEEGRRLNFTLFGRWAALAPMREKQRPRMEHLESFLLTERTKKLHGSLPPEPSALASASSF